MRAKIEAATQKATENFIPRSPPKKFVRTAYRNSRDIAIETNYPVSPVIRMNTPCQRRRAYAKLSPC